VEMRKKFRFVYVFLQPITSGSITSSVIPSTKFVTTVSTLTVRVKTESLCTATYSSYLFATRHNSKQHHCQHDVLTNFAVLISFKEKTTPYRYNEKPCIILGGPVLDVLSLISFTCSLYKTRSLQLAVITESNH